ncbi:hypothetical protein K443DRAFT_71527, partial [Laccaria amethystina LaAM-08-1]
LLCSLKGQKRREVHVSVLGRYSTFSVLVGRYSGEKRDKRCVFPRSKDISHILFWYVDSL